MFRNRLHYWGVRVPFLQLPSESIDGAAAGANFSQTEVNA